MNVRYKNSIPSMQSEYLEISVGNRSHLILQKAQESPQRGNGYDPGATNNVLSTVIPSQLTPISEIPQLCGLPLATILAGKQSML